MKQTAVEWLEIRYISNGSYLTRSDIFFAKEMEKKQREIDFKAGNDSACMEHEYIKEYFDKYIKSE